VQKKVCEYLNSKNYLFWRNNNQPTFDKKLNNGYGGYRAQSKWTPHGLPDLILLHPGDTKPFPYPVCIGIELKKPSGSKISADQLLMQRRFGLANHEYFIVRSVDDVKKLGL